MGLSAEWEFLITLNERLRPLKDPIEIQETAVRLLGQYLDASRVSYIRIDDAEYVLVRSYADGVPPLTGRGPIAHFGSAIVDACRHGKTVAVDDVEADPRFTKGERRQLRDAKIAALIEAPLFKDQRWLAMFAVHSAAPRAWSRDQIALVEVTAERAWAAAERARAEEAVGRSESRQAFLRRLNDTIRPIGDPARILAETGRMLGMYLRVNRVAYGEIDGDDCIIVDDYVDGVPSLAGRFRWRDLGASRTDEILQGGTLSVNDTATESHTPEEREALEAAGIGAYICPLLIKDGRFVASFGIHSRTPRVWTLDEITLAQEVADRIWATLEHRKAEEALREQGHRLRVALDAAAGGSWTWIAATNQVDWDERFRSLYGFTADEPATADAWIPRVHADDRPRILASLDEIYTSPTKDSWENTFRIVRPDGTVTWIQSRGRAERDADGRLIRLSGLDFDFSQHHRDEEALQARRDEEHHRTLQTLLETATQGIVSMDADDVIVTANRAVETMFGWSATELIGQPIARLMPAVCDEPEPHDLPLLGMRKDGSTFPIEVSVTRVATSGDSRTFAFVTDITERQGAASALQSRTAELEYRTTQLRRLASDLTLAEQHAREGIAKTLHDGLQQLLVIVSLNLEQQLKRDSRMGQTSAFVSEAKHHVDEAIAAARSLSVELYPPVLQRSGLPAALRWLGNWIQDKYKVDVQVNADPAADSARKDIRTLLFESVRELLFNAVKHARATRVTLDVALDSDDHLCITVTDAGVGFDPSRLDDRSKAAEPGWGLFRIRERLMLLGGHFEIDSSPGRGTRARLVAPRRVASDAGVSRNRLSLAPIEPATRHDSRAASDALRILIVDDHATVRSTLREILEERPQLSVIGDASNGFEAIAHAHTLRPDVILMDVAMPHMDGVEATARIRAELPGIQILGLSMQERSETTHAIEQAGAARYFMKGLDTERLIDHLLVFHASRAAGDHPHS